MSTQSEAIPSIDEQTKIANFLSSIDKKIELVQMGLEKTKEFKKHSCNRCLYEVIKMERIISKSFNSKLIQPNIRNNSTLFEELSNYTEGLLK